MTNKFLIFTTRQMCYHSAGFFAAQMASELENMGYECELCQLPEEGIASAQGQATYASDCEGAAIQKDIQQKLEGYIGKEYTAVIDFNSKLPRLVLDDGSCYLNHIDAPFYNYILDNPLYHHSTLECPLSRYHVLLVDQNHCDYVRRYYSHIKSVHMLPLGASIAVSERAFQNKEACVLFMGTYRNPSVYLEQIKKTGGQAALDMQHMIEVMQADSACTMENALKKILADSERVVTDHEFALMMNYYYPVEMYLRNAYREQLITALLKGGIPIKIVGDWWQNYRYADSSGLQLEKPVRFDKSFEKIAANAVLVDSSPFFKNGVHDRVFSGMANHTAVLTDSNPYLEEKFAKKNLIKTYSLDSMQELCSVAEELLINGAKRKSMVDKAFEEYEKAYRWHNVAERFVEDCLEK